MKRSFSENSQITGQRGPQTVGFRNPDVESESARGLGEFGKWNLGIWDLEIWKVGNLDCNRFWHS